jgi:hypothetical protein
VVSWLLDRVPWNFRADDLWCKIETVLVHLKTV